MGEPAAAEESEPEPEEEVKEVKLSKKKQAALDKKAKAEEEQPVEAPRLLCLRTAPPPAHLVPAGARGRSP